MPGDPDQCHLYAARYVALGERAWRPEVRLAFIGLAETWKRLWFAPHTQVIDSGE
jgi:hypothetical protein